MFLKENSMVCSYRKTVQLLAALSVLFLVSAVQAEMKITLKSGKVIDVPVKEDDVKSISYVDSPGGEKKPVSDAMTIRIQSAKYGNVSFELGDSLGYKQYFCDAGPALAEKCDGNDRCKIIVGSNICGDPYPGKGKYLYVEYSCGSRLKRSKMSQTEIMRLKCP